MEPLHSSPQSPCQRPRLSGIVTALLIVSTLASSTSCRSNEARKDEAPNSRKKAAPQAQLQMDPDLWKKAITQVGQNEAAVFSPQGDRLLFLSRERLSHRQRQLYEINLKDRQERRLTFQDGEVIEAFYAPGDGGIYYASTTDEIKEKPALFYPDLEKSPWSRTEIYRIRQDDDLHERLTQNEGFDGFLHVHQAAGTGPVLTFSRLHEGRLALWRTMTQNVHLTPLMESPTRHLLGFTSHPREGWTAWVEENPDTEESEIVLSRRGQKQTRLVTGLRSLRHLNLWSNRDSRGQSTAQNQNDDVFFLFTAKAEAHSPRQAYWMSLNRQCATKIDLGPGEISSLQVSPDQTKIVWTLVQNSASQVFVDSVTFPVGLCGAPPIAK